MADSGGPQRGRLSVFIIADSLSPNGPLLRLVLQHSPSVTCVLNAHVVQKLRGKNTTTKLEAKNHFTKCLGQTGANQSLIPSHSGLFGHSPSAGDASARAYTHVLWFWQFAVPT